MDKNFLSQWYIKALVVLILFGTFMSLVAYSKLTFRDSKYGEYGMASITVTGDGEVMAVPDIGSFSFSVLAEGKDAATAQSDSATKINDVMAYLRDAGIEDKDIKTTDYNLNPKYRYEELECRAGYCPTNRVIDGYEVSQTVTVKVRDLDNAGNLITGVGDKGATNISSLSFTVDDDAVLRDQARELAIADAKTRAERLAKDLGVTLVRITGYYEDEGYKYGYGGYAADSVSLEARAATAPSIPTGENTYKASVNVSFEIR